MPFLGLFLVCEKFIDIFIFIFDILTFSLLLDFSKESDWVISFIGKISKFFKKLKLDGASNNELYVEKSEGEDWEGFNELMRKSEIKDKRRKAHFFHGKIKFDKAN